MFISPSLSSSHCTQEVNLELLDDDDDDDPMSSTENLVRPPTNSKLKGKSQTTEDDLLDQAVGLPPKQTNTIEDTDDDRFSFI